MARITFTNHAVDRFIDRHAPGMSVDEAEKLLEARAPSAVRLKTRTLLGQQQWELPEPRCILVVKPDRGRLVCVTVLPAQPDLFEDPWADDELPSGPSEVLRAVAETYPPSKQSKRSPRQYKASYTLRR